MKKVIGVLSLIVSFSFSVPVFAEGCDSLEHTTWMGQADLGRGEYHAIKLSINNVTGNNMFYDLSGTINGEPLTGAFGCIEKYGIKQINGVSFDSNNIFISSIKLMPDAIYPTGIFALSGMINGRIIDNTSTPNSNYLIKQN